jgi:hypothetical protein
MYKREGRKGAKMKYILCMYENSILKPIKIAKRRGEKER